MMISLGQEVRDRISGFGGVVTAKTQFENGCIRLCVTGRELNEGRVIDEWFDEQRLMPETREATAVRPESQTDIGGPGPNPPPRDPPTRPT